MTRYTSSSEVIQKLIFLARSLPSIKMFPRVFATKIVVMMKNQFGWRVIQTCLHSLDNLANKPLYREVVIVRHCLEIANSKYGSIAIRNCIDFMDPSPSQPYYGQDSANAYSPKERLFKIISDNTSTLAENYYGIFVLQFSIGRCPRDCLETIAVCLKPLYERSCTSENGNYLVQNILHTPCRTLVAEVLLESDHLVTIAQDAYGNYAIQALLMTTKEYKVDYYHKL